MSCRCGRHNNDTENAPLAQLVEHLTLNQGVQGSSPWRCTRENRFWRHRSSGDGSFFGFNFVGQKNFTNPGTRVILTLR